MNRISEALAALVSESELLKLGLTHGLLNLAQTAEFIRPQVEARTKKSVSKGAIHMGLSRMQGDVRRFKPGKGVPLEVDGFSVNSDLVAFTFPREAKTVQELNRLYSTIAAKHDFVNLVHGTAELTIITNRRNEAAVKKAISVKPSLLHQSVAAIGVTFPLSYAFRKGAYYSVLKELVFQNINILDLVSTASELLLFVDQKDLRLALDTLMARFGKR